MSTTKVNEHILSDFSMYTISFFRSIENKHDVYRGKDCIKGFCEFLREHAVEIISKRKHLPYYNLLIVQDLWQVHYQIFSKIFVEEFIEM